MLIVPDTALDLAPSPSLLRTAWRVVLLLWPVALTLFSFALTFGLVLLHDAVTGDFLGFLPDFFRRKVETLMGISPPAPRTSGRRF